MFVPWLQALLEELDQRRSPRPGSRAHRPVEQDFLKGSRWEPVRCAPEKLTCPVCGEWEQWGEIGSFVVNPDRAGAEHMQQFSSTAPTRTFPEHLL
ncbi:hypothetical protein D9C73_014250 [Collichthys lucidus]|uniref:Uncharacterized protein n=1 Tax=Collichthys lucidus TaxID=240159 RepID=A0A4U5UXR1_COLLU|nr:hypothetical protein D9C73_014250 [Collichthys lucidus]